MQALEIANTAREKRKDLKIALKAGEVLLADTLLSDADWLQGMRVRDLLLATPGIGKVKAKRTLRHFHLSETARLGGVPKHARVKLIAYLMAHYPRVYVSSGPLERGT
jgi:hypothetical protein